MRYNREGVYSDRNSAPLHTYILFQLSDRYHSGLVYFQGQGRDTGLNHSFLTIIVVNLALYNITHNNRN